MPALLPCEWRQSSFPPRLCNRLAVCRVRDALRPSQPSSACQEWRLIGGADERTTTAASPLAESEAECAPVAAADEDRRGGVLHQHEIAAAHVAPIGLQQERLGVGCDPLHRAVVE